MTPGKSSPIRVQGLVRAMQEIRNRLSQGIAPAQATEFRIHVTNIIAQVENACNQNRITPQELPTPSYRAYQYLTSIDLFHLPPPLHNSPQLQPKIRITNIVAISDDIAASIAALVRTPDPETTHTLSLQLKTHTDSIEKICRESKSTPNQLPPPSRRAYQWLKFLSDLDNLELHLLALTQAQNHIKTPLKTITGRTSPPIEVMFRFFSHLYEIRQQPLRLTLHEGFINAPPETLGPLLEALRRGDAPTSREIARAYSETEEFCEIITALEINEQDNSFQTRGRCYDLETVFARVNAQYFNGQMAHPRLTWNQTLTLRKLGHYHFSTDTVMLSITLDDPRIPPEVIDFVMYHELLHKELGIKTVNGRRYAHTSEFRAAEQRFQHYATVEKFLSRTHKK